MKGNGRRFYSTRSLGAYPIQSRPVAASEDVLLNKQAKHTTNERVQLGTKALPFVFIIPLWQSVVDKRSKL